MALALLLPIQSGVGHERGLECREPAWWRSYELPYSAVDDPLAALEPRYSAAEAYSVVSGRPLLVCPDGAVLVDSWVERRDVNISEARRALIAPAPDRVDACFGRPSCALPLCEGSLCGAGGRVSAGVARDDGGGGGGGMEGAFRAAIAANCAHADSVGHAFAGVPTPAGAGATAAAAGDASPPSAVAPAVEPARGDGGGGDGGGDDVDDAEHAEGADQIIPLEEWKARVLAKIAAEEPARADPDGEPPSAAEGAAAPGQASTRGTSATSSDAHAPSSAAAEGTAPPSAHARTPLRQRFNYGAFDAGARLVASNPEAKSASAILKGDRDQYMLNPCAARKWVVVALPEDIKVDAVSLSNHELFASSVHEWQLLGSMKYPTELWFELGKFEAADSKQPQDFILTQPNWARYLKLRLISHHRTEHYCTLSQLSVYGQTVMDDFAEAMELQRENLEEMRARVQSAAARGNAEPSVGSGGGEPAAPAADASVEPWTAETAPSIARPPDAAAAERAGARAAEAGGACADDECAAAGAARAADGEHAADVAADAIAPTAANGSHAAPVGAHADGCAHDGAPSSTCDAANNQHAPSTMSASLARAAGSAPNAPDASHTPAHGGADGAASARGGADGAASARDVQVASGGVLDDEQAAGSGAREVAGDAAGVAGVGSPLRARHDDEGAAHGGANADEHILLGEGEPLAPCAAGNVRADARGVSGGAVSSASISEAAVAPAACVSGGAADVQSQPDEPDRHRAGDARSSQPTAHGERADSSAEQPPSLSAGGASSGDAGGAASHAPCAAHAAQPPQLAPPSAGEPPREPAHPGASIDSHVDGKHVAREGEAEVAEGGAPSSAPCEDEQLHRAAPLGGTPLGEAAGAAASARGAPVGAPDPAAARAGAHPAGDARPGVAPRADATRAGGRPGGDGSNWLKDWGSAVVAAVEGVLKPSAAGGEARAALAAAPAADARAARDAARAAAAERAPLGPAAPHATLARDIAGDAAGRTRDAARAPPPIELTAAPAGEQAAAGGEPAGPDERVHGAPRAADVHAVEPAVHASGWDAADAGGARANASDEAAAARAAAAAAAALAPAPDEASLAPAPLADAAAAPAAPHLPSDAAETAAAIAAAAGGAEQLAMAGGEVPALLGADELAAAAPPAAAGAVSGGARVQEGARAPPSAIVSGANSKEGVLKALTSQMHALELNVSLTTLWLTEFSQRNNATLTELKRKVGKAKDDAAALSAHVRALEEAGAAGAAAVRELHAELRAIDTQFALLVSTIERQNALHARDLERVRVGAQRELLCALAAALALGFAATACSQRGASPARAASGAGGGYAAGTRARCAAFGGSGRDGPIGVMPSDVRATVAAEPDASVAPDGAATTQPWHHAWSRQRRSAAVPRSHTLETLRPLADGEGAREARPVVRLSSQPMLSTLSPLPSPVATPTAGAHGVPLRANEWASRAHQLDAAHGGPDGFAGFALDADDTRPLAVALPAKLARA
ncbi:hypothetical protein KFE25_010171 [Diacronema lutheri]|uniref:SUN domain-containing protein n=2 Tax=Diacronema lutheri TaxID=2081491 RepID=A0A8J5XI49_DIALT|nr:hypothetical protein KFE25_010171 [Diacronema lutheri]